MTQLSQQIVDGVAEYVRRGVPVRTAGEAHGLAGDEVDALIREGGNPRARGLKRALADKVRRAKAEFRASQAMVLTKHAIGFRDQNGDAREGDWRAAELALTHAATADELDRLNAIARGDD